MNTLVGVLTTQEIAATLKKQIGTSARKDYDCGLCHDSGSLYRTDENGVTYGRQCECQITRLNLRKIELSGLKNALDRLTFESYATHSPWQIRAKHKALMFAENPQGWFFVGGQIGAGKTHLCTAVAGWLLNQGNTTRYMRWREESVRLKQRINDSDYHSLIDSFKKTTVLYIDDFFNGKSPTIADINLAFEIIDYRYSNNDLITIISSERHIEEILDIDEAIGSRVFERAKHGGVLLEIERDKSKNYRLSSYDT
jgi:DNA replication protein DnaC